MGLVLLIVVGTSAVFAQTTPSQGKYYLEMWNISQATYDTLQRLRNDPNTSMEDDLALVRTASGTSVRSKDRGLTGEQVRQKLLDINPQGITNWGNTVNNFILQVQRQWVSCSQVASTTPRFWIYYWLRRTE